MNTKKPSEDENRRGQSALNEVLASLRRRSAKSLELAKRDILTMPLHSQKAREALEYYADNWDDITHPGILSLACEAAGGDLQTVVPMQMTMLLLAAATDIHDDIIDQSKVKNGRPTMYGKFGKKTTLLLGDALFMEGFLFLHRCTTDLPQTTVEKVMSTIEGSFLEFGNAHLSEIDLQNKPEIAPEEYLRILEQKGSTIEVHARIGAIVGGGTGYQIEAMGRYGKILGNLIAMREEFVDLFDSEELQNRMGGKNVPLPILYAFRDHKVKENILSLVSSPKWSSKSSEKVVSIVFADKNVRKLIGSMRNLSKKGAEYVNQPEIAQRTKNELQMLIYATLEDL